MFFAFYSWVHCQCLIDLMGLPQVGGLRNTALVCP